MYNKEAIATIKKLLDENTEASLTYAALECRLAIEYICYSHLKVAHDYISHDDIRAWQPRKIIDILIQHVDPHAGSSFTLRTSEENVEEGENSSEFPDTDNVSWVYVGEQVGFDPKKLGSLWNKLANAALHIKVPKSRSDDIRRYGDSTAIRQAVLEALKEIERIEKSTLTSGGIGDNLSFKCSCGMQNMRRLSLLIDDQVINCINPNCDESYIYSSGSQGFQRRSISVKCDSCGAKKRISTSYLERKMKIGSSVFIRCECGNTNYLGWSISQWSDTENRSD